jgi:hypothetical protein
MHEPLSQRLARILESDGAPGGLTLNQLIERTEGRGIFSIVILLCLPFVGPVSIMGMSTPFGLAIALLALRLAGGQAPRLPKRVGDRAMPVRVQKVMRRGGVKFLRFLEKMVKPRRVAWMDWPWARKANARLVVFMACLLALPLPPLPPFTNAFPSYAIILIAASMMEEDGIMIWAGYAVSLGTIIYFGLWAGVIATHLVKWWDKLIQVLPVSL